METVNELLFEDDSLEDSCLAQESCIEELLRAAPPGCLYCALRKFEDEDD